MMKKIIIGFFIVAGFCIWLPTSHFASGQTNETIIIGRARAIDGDTIMVWQKGFYKGKGIKIRLYGLDAPEMDSRAGVIAKKAMAQLLTKNQSWVACRTINRDVYHRWVAICYFGRQPLAKNNNSINLSMLRLGYAFAYRYFLRLDNFRDYLSAERYAQKSNLGFWADKNFVRYYRNKKNF
ncbi:MAG: thermonuclease family protein [Alphaproteobacteria bacterium]